MDRQPLRWWLHAVLWPAALVVLTVLASRPPWSDRLGADYIQFWSASRLIVTGQNPYDAQLQAAEQRLAGWDVERHGLGRYTFMPYYYPPWVAIVLSPLTLLDYAWAKGAWMALLTVAIAAAGVLMRRALPRWEPLSAMAVAWLFGYWWMTLPIGQTAPLVVLLMAGFWYLSETRRDRAAGWLLACLTLKPQLTLALLVAVVVWLIRQRRWLVLEGMLMAGTVLTAASTLLFPSWLPAMLAAPRETPLLIVDEPALGATWYSLLRTLGLTGPSLAIAYTLLAIPAMGLLVRTAWKRQSPLLEVVGLGTLTAFVVAPYARYYDLPIALPALYWLLSRPLPGWIQALLAAAAITAAPLFLNFGPVEPSVVVAEAVWMWLVVAAYVLWLIPTREASASLSTERV